MNNKEKKSQKFIFEQSFNSVINQLYEVINRNDIQNRRRRLILRRYPQLYKSYKIIKYKSATVQASRQNSLFTNFPFIGNKTDSIYIETAIPNLISVIDMLIMLEKSREFRDIPHENRKFIRQALDVGIKNLATEMYVPHSKTRTISLVCILSVVVIGAYVLAAVATPGGLLAILMAGVCTAAFLAFGTPIYENLTKIKCQFSSEKTQVFQGYAHFRTTAFRDLINQFTHINYKKIDLTNHTAVLNSVVTHTNSPLRISPLKESIALDNIIDKKQPTSLPRGRGFSVLSSFYQPTPKHRRSVSFCHPSTINSVSSQL